MNTVLICLIICTIYGFIIYQILNRRLNRKVDNKTFLKEVKEEIALLVAQINETSDRNVLLVEHRLERLNSLLSLTDSKISELKTLQTITEVKKRPVESNIVVEVIPEPVEEVVEETPEVIPSMEMVDQPDLSRKERILLLHNQGISPSVIASQTKATIGEVELIISLSRS